MNVSKLCEGMIIKNYKELCSVLGIRVCSGNSKIKQLEEFNLYCKYERQGNKYIIKEVYKNPTLTLNDILKTRNNKYIKLLSDVLLEQLYKHPNNLKNVTLIKLFTMLGITNYNYQYANNYRKELSQLYDVRLSSIYYFYSNTRNEFKRIIERCLNNLQKRSVLFWSQCIMIIDKEKGIYKADEETTKLILDTQKGALQYLKVNNMFDLFADKKKVKEFNSIIRKELTFNYFYAYDIVVGEKAIKIEYDNILEQRKKLNTLIIDKSNKVFNKEFYKRYKSDYKLLIDLLINTECNEDMKDILKDKHKENIDKYNQGYIDTNIKHYKEIELLKDKYLDTYKIENDL